MSHWEEYEHAINLIRDKTTPTTMRGNDIFNLIASVM